jgi:hypothetical protein
VAATPEESPEPALSPEEAHGSPLSPKESPEPALSPEEAHGSPLSQWLQLMLAEIARKRDALEQAHTEQLRREAEAGCASHQQPDRGAGS